jgi:hypothetical protein
MSARRVSLFVLLAVLPAAVQVSAEDGGTRHSESLPALRSIFQLAELKGSNVQYLSNLGYSIAVSGNTVVVGAPGGSDGQGDFTDGSAYVYVKSADGWSNMTQVAILTASDSGGANGFGLSVAISGNTIVVNSNLPEIYVFSMPAGGWVNMTETAILSVPSTGLNPCLCGQVVIDGNTIAVGSPLDSLGNLGSIEVFVKPASGWKNASEPSAVLSQPDAGSEEQSFRSIAISGKTIVGEGLSFSSGTGEYFIYLFLEPAKGWNGNYTPQATLSSTQAGNYFGGGSVAVSGNTVIAGSNSPNLTYFPPSFVDVWVEPAGGWTNMTQTAQLSDGTASYADGFGTSIGIAGKTIVVGTPAAIVIKTGKSYRGAAYVFNEPAEGWQTTTKPNLELLNSDWTSNDGFGSSVAMSGSTIVVGAPLGPNGSDNGEAYIFAQ